MAARWRLRPLVIITSAEHPVASATATRLAREGAFLVLQHRRCALATERTNALAARIVADGGEALPIRADLDDEAGLRTLADAAWSLGPHVHALVHTAHAARARADLSRGPLLSLAHLRAALRDEDTLSLLAVSDVLTPLMGEGSAIVSLLASHARAADETGTAGAAALSSGAALSLVRTLARELGPRGIRVNALLCDALLAPGSLESSATERELAPTAAEAAVVAGTAAFLLSTDAAYVTGIDVHVRSAARSTALARRQQEQD